MNDIERKIAKQWADPEFRAQEIAEAHADAVLGLEDEDGS